MAVAGRNWFVDFGPLRRNRDFRLLWFGLFVTRLGTGITWLALPYQVNQLTGSPLMVGLLGAVQFVAILSTALIGGALADAVDRRRLVRLTEVGLVFCSTLLVLNASLDQPRVWPLFVLSGLGAGLNGIQRPALEAMMPRLVGHDELPAAASLNALRSSVAFLAGPLLGGVLIAAFSVRAAYVVDALTFVGSLVALFLIHAVAVPDDAPTPNWASVVEGLQYARRRPELLGTYIVDVIAMFFGMPMALMPAFAARFGDARALGILTAAPFVGSLLANVGGGWTTRIHRHGRAIVIAACCWGIGIVGLGFARSLPMAFVCFMVAGGADMISGVFRMTMWNQTIPDELRGRLAGIEMISYTTGPLLGNVESGLAAALIGVRGAIVSGGALCVGGTAAVVGVLPEFWSYDDRTHPEAVAERHRRAQIERPAASQ